MAEQAHLTVAPPAERPRVGMCVGKDCRKRCESAKVRTVLERGCDVVDLKCVGLCDGPVVVALIDSVKPAVYAKLRTKKQRSLLVAMISGDGRARKELAGRRVTKKKVAAAVVRQIRRRPSETRHAA
ncbi:hypothetical protein [uncultured Ilumatobacter sp.]|uniref:hypothetical protein n=1 Tax=uncultured Ilumatobacter sp. TaxID=879968 RepID=UPI00374F236F